MEEIMNNHTIETTNWLTKGMVSRWESGTYNFSISTLIGICEKLELNFEPQIWKEPVPLDSEFEKKSNG